MDCEKCHQLLGDFLDGTLGVRERALLGKHLGECAVCASARDDFSAILGAARESRDYLAAPPNARALWLRIRNTIEAEQEARERAALAAAQAAAARDETPLRRWLNKRWALTLPQLTAAVAAVVVGVSAITALSLQNMTRDGQDGSLARQTRQPQGARRPKPGDMLAIEYLKQRVEQRKSRWNPRMREAFEYNMSVIDAALDESLRELDVSPHDEVSEEAMNAALRDKMELLKQFSEL